MSIMSDLAAARRGVTPPGMPPKIPPSGCGVMASSAGMDGDLEHLRFEVMVAPLCRLFM